MRFSGQNFISRSVSGWLFLSLLLGPGAELLARPRPHYPVPGHEKPVALLHAGKATYLVTERSVFQLEGAGLVRKYQSSSPIQCAVVADSGLWLGTRQGLLRLNAPDFRPRPLALPGATAAPNITALFKDAAGALWVGANGLGVFRRTNSTFTQELNTPAINDGVATADSSVWIATNIGLSRKQGAAWTRYNEEGVANQEIPDNIVEKLLPDNAGNLWVIMSEGICVFEGRGPHGSGEAELPSVKFLGQPGNSVTAVAQVRGEGQLFATTMGLLLLPSEPTGRLPSLAPAADKIEPKRLLVPLPKLPGASNPTLIQVDERQRVWLVSADDVTVLTAKEFHRFAQVRSTAKLGTAKASSK